MEQAKGGLKRPVCQVPDADRPIGGASGTRPAVGTEGRSIHPTFVQENLAERLAGGKFPHPRRVVDEAGEHEPAVGAEADRAAHQVDIWRPAALLTRRDVPVIDLASLTASGQVPPAGVEGHSIDVTDMPERREGRLAVRNPP